MRQCNLHLYFGFYFYDFYEMAANVCFQDANYTKPKPTWNWGGVPGPNLEFDFNQLVLNFRIISEIIYFLRFGKLWIPSKCNKVSDMGSSGVCRLHSLQDGLLGIRVALELILGVKEGLYKARKAWLWWARVKLVASKLPETQWTNWQRKVLWNSSAFR